MDRRSSSRRYGVEIGEVKLSTLDLENIRYAALQILNAEHGHDVPRAWVTATIAHLMQTGVIPIGDTVLKTGEQA